MLASAQPFLKQDLVDTAALDRDVAHGDHRRGSARRCPASGRLRSLPEGDYPDSIRAAFTRAVAGPNDDPRWRRAERKHGFQAAVEKGPAASELRRRCVLLHHGLDPLDPPNTSMWRDGLRPVASSPWVVVH